MRAVEEFFDEYIAAWNSHDAGKIAEFFTDDGVHEDVAVGSVFHGKRELEAGLNPLFAACPDLKLELKTLFVAGNWVAQEWVMSGTQTGDFSGLGIVATGKRFSVRGASITRLRDGKIARNTDYWDMESMRRQLGQQER